MKLLNKRGQIVSNLQGFVMAIVTIGVILAIGLYVLQEMGNATAGLDSNGLSTVQACGSNATGGTTGTIVYTNCTAAYDATQSVITKLGTAPTWIGLLIVVVFASAILAYFYFRQ